MSDTLLQLFPQPAQEHELHGLYLGHRLREQAAPADRPFIYSNYVTSLDGRIAVPSKEGGTTVPKKVANDRDWRLFQELAVQADIMITSGRYLRDYAKGQAQEILQIYDDPRFADLKQWRLDNGLSPHPDLLVVSASLHFPISEALTADGRKVLIFSVETADAERIARLEEEAGNVYIAGRDSVHGGRLVAQLKELGYKTIYNATGPQVLHLLLESDVLDRLYLTYTGRLLGGYPSTTIVEGPLLDTAVDMRLNTLYYDAAGLDGLGQLFSSYRRARD